MSANAKALAILKNAFKKPLETCAKDADPSDWTTFISKMTNWDKDLAIFVDSPATLDSKLSACRFPPLDTPAMTNALIAYFEATKPKKRVAERESNLVPLLDGDSFAQLVKWLEAQPLGTSCLPASALCSAVENGLLVRASYNSTWINLLKAKKRRSVITGTPGIGKTTLRYYLLWLWLHGDTTMTTFKTVDFDHEDKSYFLQRASDGTVECFRMKQQREWSFDVFDSTLGLYELSPCDQPRQTCDTIKLAVWTASPGCADAHGKQLLKLRGGCKLLVLPEWDFGELMKCFSTFA